MQKLMEKIHFTWFGLGGLWLLAFIAAMVNALTKPAPAFSYGPPPSHAAATFFTLTFFVYAIGGFVLGKLHNRHTAQFANASFTVTGSGDAATFHVLPAARHLPFWLFGMFGAFFLFSLPAMLTGSGFGTFFTLLLAALFFAIGLQPKLWRPIAPHDFSMDGAVLRAGGQTVPLAEVRAFLIATGLPGKSDKGQQTGSIYHAPAQTTYVTGANPLAAQGLVAAQQIGVGASAAAGQGIAEVANRYFHEMRARSWRIEAAVGRGNLIVARGLDAYTAEALLADLAARHHDALKKPAG